MTTQEFIEQFRKETHAALLKHNCKVIMSKPYPQLIDGDGKRMAFLDPADDLDIISFLPNIEN